VHKDRETALRPSETIVARLEDLSAYEGNPRVISEEAVAKVRKSIEMYGYNQPIVVDPQGVVVVGHTRLRALQEMGVEEVEVYVSPLSDEKNNEYRLVDNRTGETSRWDHETLVMELRELDDELRDEYFPNIDLEVSALGAVEVTDADVERVAKEMAKMPDAPYVPMTQIECPQCDEVFEVESSSLPSFGEAG